MTPKELSKLNVSVRELINAYMLKKNMTLNGFAKACGIHQNQLWLYLNTDKTGDLKKGLHSNTLEKIGDYISRNA
jgi:hypothetical protein